MKNDLEKLILGFVIGGLLSGSIFYLLKAKPKEKQLFFKKFGKIVVEIGDFLKESDLEDQEAILEELMKNVPKKGHIADLMTLAGLGIILWKKWR